MAFPHPALRATFPQGKVISIKNGGGGESIIRPRMDSRFAMSDMTLL